MKELLSQTPQKHLSDIKKLGNNTESITKIRKLLVDFPKFIPGWIELGLIYRRIGDRKSALNTFEKIFQLTPDHPKVKLELATEQLYDGQIREGRNNLQELLEINPQNELAIIKLGELHRSENNRAKALESFQKALKFHPKSFAANFNVAIELRELGDLETAEQHFIQALKYNQNHVYALIQMSILQQKKQNYHLALEYLQKAIARDSQKIEFHLIRLGIFCDMGRFDEVKNQVNQLTLENIFHNISEVIKLGIIYRRLGDHESALNTFKQGIKLAPNNIKIKLELATEQLYNGQLKECHKNLQEILKIEHQNELAIIKLGELYRSKNHRIKALESFQKALKFHPKSFAANFNVAIESRELGDLETAEQHFIQALKYKQNHVYALIQMGILQQKKQNFHLALEYLQKAIASDPTKIEPQVVKLNVLWEMGRFDEAKNHLEKLRQKYPNKYNILIISGHFEKKFGQEQKAITWFSLAKEKAENQNQELEARILEIEAMVNLGYLDKALRLVEFVIQKLPDNLRPQLIKGNILQKKLNLIEAQKVYKNILSIEPNHLESRIELAKIYSQTCQIAASINLFEETYQLLGANLHVFLELGLLHQALENFDLASQWYQQAYQKYPYKYQGYYHLANLMFIQGKTESAIKLLQEAQAIMPHSLPIIIRLIDFQIRLGNFDLSKQLLKDALEQFPNNIPLLWQLCRLYMEQGDYAPATKALDRISTDNQNWIGQTQKLRANIYFEQYDYQKAENHFKQAISSLPLATIERERLATILMITGRIQEVGQELKISTEKLNLKTPPNQFAVPLRSHPAMITNELGINPPLMKKLQAAQQKIGSQRILALGTILAEEPFYLGAALYLGRELRTQGIFDQIQATLSQNSTNLPTIPQRIVQFWDELQPPQEVQKICQSWRDRNPQYEYIRFSLKTAIAFIKEYYDRQVLKAFTNCAQPATQADFFRLAYLNKMGGFYADADDLCRQSLDTIVSLNPELVVIQEDLAVLGNNFLGCVPGQAMIRAAFEQAVENLSDYSNESPWFATGPGLLTSAVCSGLVPYLTHKDYQLWPRISVLSQAQLKKIVYQHMSLPYKKTAKSWQRNAYQRRIKY